MQWEKDNRGRKRRQNESGDTAGMTLSAEEGV